MSLQIPITEPEKITQGDLVQWKKTLSDFSPADYTLTYALRGPKKIDIVATADAPAFSVSVPAATTATWLPGRYYWQARITGTGGAAHTVGRGEILILKNLAAVTDDNYDGRSDAKISLDCIEAVLKKSATRVQEEYVIDGVQVKDKPIAELLKLRDHYIELVKQEQSLLDIENGRPGRRKILTRFVR